MEAESVAIATEQPCSLAERTTDHGSAVKVPKVNDANGMGTSVDDFPLIDLSASSKESISSEDQSEISAESDTVVNQSIDTAKLESQVSAPVSDTIDVKSEQENCQMESDVVAVKKEEKVDRLAKLAEQIDDFDPSPILGKPSQAAVIAAQLDVDMEFSGDINDDQLIDKLLEDTNKKGDSKTPDSEKTDSVEREATPGKEETESSETEENEQIVTKTAKSNAEAAGNEEMSQQNGEMSASTESEGFQEEKSNGEVSTDKQEVAEENKETENKDDAQKTETASPTKTAKSKRKEDKSIEHILKALSSLQTTEEKLAALCKKYADLHEDHRVLQSSYKQNQRKLTVTTREKDQLQAEHTKAVMAKSKLESLCRELQKHNQTIRQESLQRAKEEDEKRKEISQKFQTTIGEIQTQMQDNHERNKQLREENFELANKLKKFIEQYEAREQQVEKVIQHRELEQKLADAKLEQASAILMEEKGKNQKEKELLILQTTEYMKKMQLKDAELNMYKERYDDFQSTIKKSEEMFTKFKVEMDKMTKRCKKMEKDGAQWKGKWENANRALLEMAEEKTKYDKERGLLMTKINKLESLCRAMQAERQARKLLETEKFAVTAEMEKLGLHPDQIPELRNDPVPEYNQTVTGSSFTPDTSEQAADSTTPGEDPEANCTDNGPGGEGDSDNSCASEQTGITVIQQNPPNAEQGEANSQSEGQMQEVTSSDQSGTSCQQENDQPAS